MSQEKLDRILYFKVGLFALVGLLVVGFMTVFVNDKPYWWRGCNLVHINIEDATGLKTKSPVRSLGLQVGYLNSVELTETYVRLGICITAPVEVLGGTRAYIRGEGFLGDKFVELKPLRYVGDDRTVKSNSSDSPAVEEKENKTEKKTEQKQMDSKKSEPHSTRSDGSVEITLGSTGLSVLNQLSEFFIPTASAEDRQSRDIPVGEQGKDIQQLAGKVDELVEEVTSLTKNINSGIDSEELKKTIQELNKTLQNAAQMLSPKGNITITAQRTLSKLEDSANALYAQLVRINEGKGSVGMLLNDPSYAEELGKALKSLNKLLGRASEIEFRVDVGVESIRKYNGSRSWFKLGIWPAPDRYYLIGVTSDPRGKVTTINTTTTVAGLSTTTQTVQNEPNTFLFTAMLGKVFYRRIDLAVGAIYGDGALSTAFHVGPNGRERMLELHADVYSRVITGNDAPLNTRIFALARPFPSAPFSSLYVQGGLEGVRKVNGEVPWSFGGGITFTDEDIKLLFAFR